MRKLVLSLVLAAAIHPASAIDTRYAEVKSKEDIDALAAIPEWRRGADTNGVTITVCVGKAVLCLPSGTRLPYTLARSLTFDAEGRLASVSKVTTVGCMDENGKDLSALEKTWNRVATRRTRYTPAQPKGRLPSATPRVGGK